MRNKLLLAGVMSFAAGPAFAGEPCRSAKDIARLGQSFYGNHPDLTNVITPEITLAFKGLNGLEPPTAILYRHEGKEDTLPVVDGRLTQLEKLATWSKDGEMCRMNGDELAPATDGDSVEANMGFSFPYKRQDGLFTVDELKEGAKDGSKVMKSIAPGGLGFAVPGLKAISLAPALGFEEPPKFSFSRRGEPVTVDFSRLGSTTLIRLKDVKASKADMLKIEGPYLIGATFKFDPEDIAAAEAERVAEINAGEN